MKGVRNFLTDPYSYRMASIYVSAVDSDQVWKALSLWNFNPSAYNKTVGASNFICAQEDQKSRASDTYKSFFQNDFPKFSSYAEVKKNVCEYLTEKGLHFEENVDFWDLRTGCWTILRFNVPKNGKFNANTINLIQCDFNLGIFKISVLRLLSRWDFIESYTITFDGRTVKLCCSLESNDDFSRIVDLFKLKFEKWTRDGVKSSGAGSLSLLSTEEYITLYNQLKKKYCESIRRIWTESTDPDKFIHEDVAIATYLILLWEYQTKKFVDLGCGNGLLVHILNSEGHHGYGIDVRSRKIWSNYPVTTVLKEETIVPTVDYVFPDVDWIIGNHSDELSPWIPVITCLSSEQTNFFLLPCCAYEFNGVKFRRTDSSKSVYMGYLDYLENLSLTLGFEVCRDRLKIPSTKRICLISKGRTCSRISAQSIKGLINERCHDGSAELDNVNLVANFKPREPTEKVRNCTQLDRHVVISLITKISTFLLAGAPCDADQWQQGVPISISNLAGKLGREELLQLKRECGGLQTFLRNHQYIFQIVNNEVNFRRPIVKENRPIKWKTKPCWFYSNHPQSCPLSDDECYFVHAKN